MVKRRIIGLFALPILLLNSCNQQSLRSDIKQFIASFSLEESIKEYQEAGYDSLEVITVEGEGTTKTEESIRFNVKEDSPNYYHYLHKEYVNDELMVHKFIDIEEDNGKFIYHSETVDSKEITAAEMSNIVIKFFYKTTTGDIDFHNYGCYYGDIVKESAYSFQNYTTIDQENGLYIVKYEYKFDQDNATIKQELSVNSLGMLVKNHAEVIAGNNSSITDIQVYKN